MNGLKEQKMKYKTIVIDPPWDIDFKSGWGMTKKKQYSTMNQEALKDLPIQKLADKKCNLFLWVTQTTLEDGLALMKHWGFKYHITITWNKGHGLHAHGFFRQTELCLYGFKGGMNITKSGKSIKTNIETIPDIFYSRSNGHSKKPELLQDLIDLKAEGNKLEMFARRERKGWSVFGNEVENSIDLSEYYT